jgi:transposase-like protein
MGVDTDGKKHILGLKAGGTENHVVVKDLLADLIERGLDPTAPRLFVLDGSKALHKAVTETFGDLALIQRCQVHKKRNVLSYLPESQKDWYGLQISLAYQEFDYDIAHKKLKEIADSLDSRYPDAAASLLEGLEETLTVNKLQVPGRLRKTLATTNPIEAANSAARDATKRNKRYNNGEMVLKHMAAGYVQAEASFRRITGYKEIPFVVNALHTKTNCSNSSDFVTA